MGMYSSLWNADDWTTQGGLVKTDWSKAPFTAYCINFKGDACVGTSSSCSFKTSSSGPSSEELDARGGRGSGGFRRITSFTTYAQISSASLMVYHGNAGVIN
ncbi:unnamed protein product [Thlaspi arvense]|uniref:GH16 domain-containing protein n=1 Tax=Thlaspi arvense TaxID=13288 RepID=A0AAU9RK75_THLAR|nr:unnamed protein product [Thlaspi arvense]